MEYFFNDFIIANLMIFLKRICIFFELFEIFSNFLKVAFFNFLKFLMSSFKFFQPQGQKNSLKVR